MSEINGHSHGDDEAANFLAFEAEQREALHADHTTERFSKTPNLVGLAGEVEFSRMSGVPVDFTRKIAGDHGIDFKIPLRFTVDVKTTRNPKFLICEEGKVFADIYVLASYSDENHLAELLGWEWGTVLARAPVKDLGKGIINHCIERAALKPMTDLGKRIMRLT